MKTNITLKRETKGLIKVFYIIVVAMYFFAILTISCCRDIFADGHTAFFWFGEIMTAANKTLFIGILSCLFCEKFF